MRKFVGNLVLAAISAVIGAGHASAENFTWSFTGSDGVTNESGTLSATSVGADTWSLTGGSITGGTYGIGDTLVVGSGVIDSLSYDSTLYFPTQQFGSFVDYQNGIMFGNVGQTQVINIFSNYGGFAVGNGGSTSLYTGQGGSYSGITDGTLAVTAVPEPSSFALLGLGGLGLAIGAYRRRKMGAV